MVLPTTTIRVAQGSGYVPSCVVDSGRYMKAAVKAITPAAETYVPMLLASSHSPCQNPGFRRRWGCSSRSRSRLCAAHMRLRLCGDGMRGLGGPRVWRPDCMRTSRRQRSSSTCLAAGRASRGSRAKRTDQCSGRRRDIRSIGWAGGPWRSSRIVGVGVSAL